jgi:protein involved in polysaccharide export with SLBB domain
MSASRLRWLGVIAALLLCGGVRPLVAQSQVAQSSAATPFQVGDRILLSVEGDSALSDTFTVVAGPAIRLPYIGDISLANVPRTQVESYLTQQLGRYIHDAAVRARALIRVSVMGQVARPGFYAVPVDLVLPDALMVAGGATQDARLEKLQILRGTTALWRSDALQAAIARGATLEDLGVRAGDRIEVPRGISDPESKWRIAGIIIGSLATAVGVIALTHR